MKKMLILVIVVFLLFATVLPVLAYNGGGDAGNNTGDGEPPGWASEGLDGEPPGWSKVNPGNGGTGPGQ